MDKKNISSHFRVVVFASHDNNGIIKKYVYTYLKRLKEISDYIVFISDCYYQDVYLEKLSGLVDYYDCSIHHEYDFGSYKRGVNYLIQNNMLEKYDELILCNDSCLCIDSLSSVFIKMKQKHVDFWSIVLCKKEYEHLQSYFLVFNKSVFSSTCFQKYFLAVKKEKIKGDVINHYEHPLKNYFESEGFSSGYLVTDDSSKNPLFYPLYLIKNGCFLIKKKIFLDVFFSKEPVLVLLFLIKKYYKNNITDILELCNSKSFYMMFFKLFYKKYFFSTFNLSNGIKGFGLFSFIFFHKNKECYVKKTQFLISSIKIFIYNIKKYRALYFKNKFMDDYFFNIERVYLSRDIDIGKKVAVYGFGPYGKDFISNCMFDYRIVGIFDRQYLSMSHFVKKPDCIDNTDFDYVIVSVMAPEARNSVINFLISKNIPVNKIVYIDYC